MQKERREAENKTLRDTPSGDYLAPYLIRFSKELYGNMD